MLDIFRLRGPLGTPFFVCLTNHSSAPKIETTYSLIDHRKIMFGPPEKKKEESNGDNVFYHGKHEDMTNAKTKKKTKKKTRKGNCAVRGRSYIT